MIAQRTAWNNFPDVILHAEELAVKKHPTYSAAKSGDADAAFALVQDTISHDAVSKIRDLISDRKIILVSAHAFEKDGVNTIPEAFADELGR